MFLDYFYKQNFLKFLFVLIIFININFVKKIYSTDIRVNLELEDIQNLTDPKTGQNIPTVFVGENFKIKVIVIGQDKDDSDVEIVGLDQFNVAGINQFINMSMINSEFSSQKNYIYDVSCLKEGIFTIGPAKIMQNNKTINSVPENLVLQVKKRTAGTVARGTNQNGLSQEQSYEVFCKLSIDAKTVFVGQPLVLSAKVYSRGNILQIGMEKINLPGFISKEIQKVGKYQEEFEGKNYTVLEKKFLLLPQETGRIDIDPVVINFNTPVKRKNRRGGFFDDDFFGGLPVFFGENYQQKKALSNNLQINVLPLPEYAGVVDGVGDFKQFKAYVDKNEVFVNEPILFNLQIEGKGNLDQIVAPKLKLPNSFRSYESKTDVEQDLVIDYLGGKKKFEYVLQIPQKGEYQIPAQAFTYFDTQSKRYKTLKTSSLKLNIKESEQIREQANNKVEIKEQDNSNKNNLESKQDINFIEENIQDFSENQKSFFLKIFANLNSLKFPGIIFLILLLLPVLFSFKKYLKPVKKVANKLFLNKFKKTKTSSKLLKKLEEIIEKKQKEKLYQFFLNYLSFKFDIQENTMNQDLIQEMLLKINWNHDKINKFLNYLNECAGVSFAAKLKTGHATIENEKLLNASKYWFFYLESENNRG